MRRAALLSVSDRSGLVDFAAGLKELGFELLTTGGTGKALTEAGISSTAIEVYTGQKEILDGRVKTLHPRIHAGLLAKRDDPGHLAQLEADGIWPIDVAAVNLYPFIENLASDRSADPRRMVELVDIGGPTMIRAAAKNFSGVYPVIDPDDYPAVLAALAEDSGPRSLALRCRLAAKVFSTLANYNLEIAKYFSEVAVAADGTLTLAAADLNLGSVSGLVLQRSQTLRYGENPQQPGAFYLPWGSPQPLFQQLGGKELSYNNFLDFDAGCRLLDSLPPELPAVAILKHLNPCGAAQADSLAAALERAKQGDPRSHFGGVIVCNREVDEVTAAGIISDFAEIVAAPAFTPEAMAALKSKKNLRVIQVSLGLSSGLELRSAVGGVLLQQSDPGVSPVTAAALMSERPLSASERVDLQLAWCLCAHVKSNAITMVKDGMLLASGGGQMSRIDATELAIHKARLHGHDLAGAVAASDAFFPFPDCVEALAAAGVIAVIAPGGSLGDDKVVAAAQRLGLTLLFAADRHFRH